MKYAILKNHLEKGSSSSWNQEQESTLDEQKQLHCEAASVTQPFPTLKPTFNNPTTENTNLDTS